MKKNLFILIVLLGNLGFIQAQSHFSPVWSGNGVDHMNFYVMPSTINGVPLEVNDEVAVFDEGYCVGVGVYSGSYDIRVKASRNDSETGVNGYTVGHSYYFKIWDASQQIEVSDVNQILEAGSSTFDIGSSAYITLEGTVECDAPPAPSVSSVDQPDCSDATGTVELSGLPESGTWTLTRTPGNVNTTGSGTTVNISDLSEGTYSWTVTDASACTSPSSDEVNIEEQPETPSKPTIGSITQPTCDDGTGSVVLSSLPSSGTWTLTRSPGGVTSTGTGTSTTVSGLGEGAYTWKVRNSEGCNSASSNEAEIDEQPSVPAAPTVGTITQPTCAIATGSVVLSGLPASGTWTLKRSPGAVSSTGTGTSTTISGLSEGSYTWTVSNSTGCTSGHSEAADINAASGTPEQPESITGNTSPCPGTSGLTYDVENVSGVSYNWSVPSGWSITGGQGSNSIRVTAGTADGSITVTPSNSCGNGTARSLSVSTNTIPEQPSAIAGNANPCQGSTELNYSVTTVSGVEYNWTVPSGWTITKGQGTHSITVTAGSSSGNINVTPSNSCGEGETQSLDVSTGPVPQQPGTISGEESPCEGSSGLTYSVTNVSGVSYNWSVPSGWSVTAGQSTNSATVTAGSATGNITVTPYNSCGNGTARSFTVTPGLVPERPGSIAGYATACQGTSLSYSIDPASNTTSYTWVLPSGWTGTSTSTSITAVAETSGEISVWANNDCGSGTARTLSVRINDIPEQPSAISGNQSVCEGSSQTYSVSDVLDADSYIWTIPSGWTGTSTLKSINITAGINGGTLSVAAKNECGTGIARTLDVTSATLSAPEIGSVTDPTCSVETGSVILNSLPASGTWTITRLPGGKTYSGSGNSYKVAGLPTGTHTFSVSNSSGCSSDESTGVTISAAPESPGKPSAENIIQPSCSVATGSVTLTGLPVSGTWTLTIQPGGSTFTGSGKSRTITGLASATTYNFSVTNDAGCTSERCSDVIINAVPQTPTAPVIGAITHQGCSTPGSVRLNGLPSAGTWTLTRTPGAVITTGTGTEALINNLYAGTYTFTITNASQCTSAASGKATVNPGPETPSAPSIDKIINPTCDLATGSIRLKNLPETGSWILTIYPDALTITGNKADTIISKLKAGDYSFMVTNSKGCNSIITDTVTVAKQPPTPKAPVVGYIIQPSCSTATGSVELKGLPSGTWNLKGISGDMDTVCTGTGTNIIISMLPAGTYIFKVTNSEGCVSGVSANVVVDAQPEIPAPPVITFSNNVLHSGSANGNQWYTLDGPIDGAVNQDYVITASGDYYVVVTNGICTSEPSDTLNVTLTGIPDTELGKSVMIYPNPVKTELTIEIENEKMVTNFEIINTLGQTVHSGEFLHQTVIDVTKFRSGVYLIRLSNDKKSIYVKVVKD